MERRMSERIQEAAKVENLAGQKENSKKRTLEGMHTNNPNSALMDEELVERASLMGVNRNRCKLCFY